MRTCGLENFTIEVIERCETQAQANEREHFWIRVLNCRMPNGYNRSNGGEGHMHIEKQPQKATVMNIAQLREQHGLNQKELAESPGINRSVLNRIENGTRPVRDDELKLLTDYFNVSAYYLLGRDAPALSDEQATLLKGFDTLNAAGRNLLVAVLDSLRVSHAAKMSNRRVAAV